MRYRDTKTGHFVSESTWKRSKKRGGTRYKPVRKRRPRRPPPDVYTISIGYDSSKENSYSLTIVLRPRKHLSDANVIKLAERLIAEGHFDDSPNNPVADLQWAALGVNAWEVERSPYRKGVIPRGRAILEAFYRKPPGSLP